MKSLINIKIVILFLTAILFQRCSTAYKPVQPDRLILWDQQYIDPDSTVTIEIVNHILGSNEFNKFVKAEKENGLHMIALKIYNHGTRELRLSEDLEFCLENGYSFYPITKDESLKVLVSALEIDPSRQVESEYQLINTTRFIGQATPRLISYFKLNKNLKEYYMKSWVLGPGEDTAGILVLPIPNSSPFQVCLR